MRFVLIGMAAALVPAALAGAPASAQRWSDPGFRAAANVVVHHGTPPMFASGPRGDRRHRRHRDREPAAFPFYGGWGYYSDPNQSWEPDSYNDWWHDRPNRALPRWVQNNRGCERVYWSGGGWQC